MDLAAPSRMNQQLEECWLFPISLAPGLTIQAVEVRKDSGWSGIGFPLDLCSSLPTPSLWVVPVHQPQASNI